MSEASMVPDSYSEIQRRVWNGSVPVRIVFRVNSKEVELFLEIRRLSYFTNYFCKVISYFKPHFLELGEAPVWLEFEGTPIQWQYPIGLLYDLLFLPSQQKSQQLLVVPMWTVSLNYRDYPSKHIIPFPNTDYLVFAKNTFINQLKQSSYVLYGNSKLIMGLSPTKSDNFWHSIINSDWNLYESINRELVIPAKIQRVPVKIFVSGSSIVIQAPVYPKTEGKLTGLKDILQENVPTLCNHSVNARAYVHGIDMDYILKRADEIPSILELWKLFKHVDNFLYITIIVQEQ